MNRVRAVQNVIRILAPGGVPIFEWGGEETPTPEAIAELARMIVDVVEAAE